MVTTEEANDEGVSFATKAGAVTTLLVEATGRRDDGPAAAAEVNKTRRGTKRRKNMIVSLARVGCTKSHNRGISSSKLVVRRMTSSKDRTVSVWYGSQVKKDTLCFKSTSGSKGNPEHC